MNLSRTAWDGMTADLGDNLTEGELYFWSIDRARQNRAHLDQFPHHQRIWCNKCNNCTCDKAGLGAQVLGFTQFRCICASGYRMVTPYKLRRRGNLGQ